MSPTEPPPQQGNESTPGVNPTHGTPDVSAPGISGNGLANTGLQYDSSNPAVSHGFGEGWLPGSLAALNGIGGGGPLSYTAAPDRTLTFLPGSTSGTWDAAHFIQEQLTEDSGDFNMLQPDGEIRSFMGGNGRIIRTISPGGRVTGYVYRISHPNQIEEIVTNFPREGGGTDVVVRFTYTWTDDLVGAIVYWVDGRQVLKTTYGYSGSKLATVKTWENSVAGTGTPDWGSAPISATRFSYDDDNGLLRHVVPPTQYKQMVNNGIDPDTATPAQLNDYAAAEYEFGDYNLVTKLRTHGRLYTYQFSYFGNIHATASVNSWWGRTDVTQPDGSRRSYYINRYRQLILEKISNPATSPTEVWYQNYQKFDEKSRLMWKADSTAILIVDENDPELVTLRYVGGCVEEYHYDKYNNVVRVGLYNGISAPQVVLNDREYTTHSMAWPGLGASSPGDLHRLSKETVYIDETGTTRARRPTPMHGIATCLRARSPANSPSASPPCRRSIPPRTGTACQPPEPRTTTSRAT